jgi:K+-sensing histidine kinase KdpD
MGESRAAHRISGSGLVARASAFARSHQDWSRIGSSVRGPLLTAAVAILFDQLTRHGMPVPHPFAFLLLTVIYSSASGGSRPGLVSALLTILYALHFLAEPGALLHYTPANAYTLLGLAIIAPLSAYMVAELREAAEHGRAVELSRAEAERLDRRLSLLGLQRDPEKPGPAHRPQSRRLVRDPCLQRAGVVAVHRRRAPRPSEGSAGPRAL